MFKSTFKIIYRITYSDWFVVQLLSHTWLLAISWTIPRQASLPSLSPRVCSNSCPLSQSWRPTILSPVTPFSSCAQLFPVSGAFSVSWLFTSGGQSIRASASASVLPMYSQGWLPLGLTGLISLLFKGLSKVFSSTAVWKNQFFGAQASLWSSSHIHTWLLGKP